MRINMDEAEPADTTAAWQLLMQMREIIDAGRRPVETAMVRLNAEAQALVDLFLPLALTSRDQGRITAVLGQTLDGYIATHDGDSRAFRCHPDRGQHCHTRPPATDNTGCRGA